MGKKTKRLEMQHIDFIKEQKIFFVATCGVDTTINISPKGADNFKIINNKTCIWRNLTGSGNETAAHLQEDNRMTIMFLSFAKKPKILRLYGRAISYYLSTDSFLKFNKKFQTDIGARQIIKMQIDLVHISCGLGVPLYEYQGSRNMLARWSLKKGADGIKNYHKERNSISLDGKKIVI
jgi:hypothetical protein